MVKSCCILSVKRLPWLLALGFLLPSLALAVDSGDFVSALQHLQGELEEVWVMMVAVSRLTGVTFVALSIYKLKAYGRMTAMMSQNTSILRPMAYLIVGALLWYLPATLDTMVATFWAYDYSSIKSYAPVGGGAVWEEAVTPIVLLLRVLGLAAFLRGWALLVRATNEGAQPGLFSKGLMYLIYIFAFKVIGHLIAATTPAISEMDFVNKIISSNTSNESR